MALTTGELSQLTLFEACAPKDLQLIADAMTGGRRIAEGDAVCVEGDRADRWWIVVDGMADVTVSGLYVGTIGPGETIGELALLDDEPRGATVTARSDMVLEEISGEDFLHALEMSPPLCLALMREMAVRLRTANRRPPIPSAAQAHEPTVPRPTGKVTQLDPRTGDYFADPQVQIAALREAGPVHWSDLFNSFMVMRYEDVHRLSRQPSLLGSITTEQPIVQTTSSKTLRPIRSDKMMIRRDGEDHTRLRRLVSRVFTPRAIDRWRDRSETIVERQLEMAAKHSEMDVIADYALPLPAQIISEMLGIPKEDIGLLRDWSSTLVTNLEPLNSPEQQEAIEIAGRRIFDYLEQLVAHKRRHPGEDILTNLIEAEDSGDVLDDEEIQAQVLLLYIAGHETTVNLIGNGVTHLLGYPEQLDHLLGDPGLAANAVEEVLRFESPAQFTRRINREPVVIDDVTIPAGSLITLALASANRDPRRWGTTADTFDVARPGANEHLSFGGGRHFCLGAALARLEAQIALPRLMRRFPRMKPTAPVPEWSERLVLRGVTRLPVSLR